MLERIKSQEDITKRKKKNQILIGLIMISILVMSTAGYSLKSYSGSSGGRSSTEEKGLDFFYNGGVWRVQINGEVYGFQYLPSEVEDIPVSGFYGLGDYINQPLYFVGEEGLIEVLNNLGRYILRYQQACLADSIDCDEALPIKDCSENSNVIIFEMGNNTKVFSSGSCVYLVGDSIKSADAFLYKILKVN